MFSSSSKTAAVPPTVFVFDDEMDGVKTKPKRDRRKNHGKQMSSQTVSMTSDAVDCDKSCAGDGKNEELQQHRKRGTLEAAVSAFRSMRRATSESSFNLKSNKQMIEDLESEDENEDKNDNNASHSSLARQIASALSFRRLRRIVSPRSKKKSVKGTKAFMAGADDLHIAHDVSCQSPPENTFEFDMEDDLVKKNNKKTKEKLVIGGTTTASLSGSFSSMNDLFVPPLPVNTPTTKTAATSQGEFFFDVTSDQPHKPDMPQEQPQNVPKVSEKKKSKKLVTQRFKTAPLTVKNKLTAEEFNSSANFVSVESTVDTLAKEANTVTQDESVPRLQKSGTIKRRVKKTVKNGRSQPKESPSLQLPHFENEGSVFQNQPDSSEEVPARRSQRSAVISTSLQKPSGDKSIKMGSFNDPSSSRCDSNGNAMQRKIEASTTRKSSRSEEHNNNHVSRQRPPSSRRSRNGVAIQSKVETATRSHLSQRPENKIENVSHEGPPISRRNSNGDTNHRTSEDQIQGRSRRSGRPTKATSGLVDKNTASKRRVVRKKEKIDADQCDNAPITIPNNVNTGIVNGESSNEGVFTFEDDDKPPEKFRSLSEDAGADSGTESHQRRRTRRASSIRRTLSGNIRLDCSERSQFGESTFDDQSVSAASLPATLQHERSRLRRDRFGSQRRNSGTTRSVFHTRSNESFKSLSRLEGADSRSVRRRNSGSVSVCSESRPSIPRLSSASSAMIAGRRSSLGSMSAKDDKLVEFEMDEDMKRVEEEREAILDRSRHGPIRALTRKGADANSNVYQYAPYNSFKAAATNCMQQRPRETGVNNWSRDASSPRKPRRNLSISPKSKEIKNDNEENNSANQSPPMVLKEKAPSIQFSLEELFEKEEDDSEQPSFFPTAHNKHFSSTVSLPCDLMNRKITTPLQSGRGMDDFISFDAMLSTRGHLRGDLPAPSLSNILSSSTNFENEKLGGVTTTSSEPLPFSRTRPTAKASSSCTGEHRGREKKRAASWGGYLRGSFREQFLSDTSDHSNTKNTPG